jgi:hypothetical protein
MAALSTIHDVTGRRLVSSIYSWDIYAIAQVLKNTYTGRTGRIYIQILVGIPNKEDLIKGFIIDDCQYIKVIYVAY